MYFSVAQGVEASTQRELRASRQWAKCKANELSIRSHREGKRHFNETSRVDNLDKGVFWLDYIPTHQKFQTLLNYLERIK